MTPQPENLKAVREPKKMKMCKFPGCKNRGTGGGRKKVRQCWCSFHRRGAGKKARQEYSNSLLVARDEQEKG